MQAIVCEASSWLLFVDYGTGKKVDLLRLGGVYADLHAALVEREEQCQFRREAWERENSKVSRVKATKL
jgi:hypothetical protein